MTANEKTSLEQACDENAWYDPLDMVIYAAAFIWAGVIWLTTSFGYVEEQAWSIFFLGAGLLVLIELAIRLLVPAHRRDLLGTAIWAGAMFCLSGWATLWPLVLVGIGVAILVHSLSPQLKTIWIKEESE